MPSVTFIDTRNEEHQVEVPTGKSLMQAALDNGIDGIVGECGGGLACATCHIIVLEGRERLPEMSSAESSMLDFAAMERSPESRLGCQIVMSDRLSGLIVKTADRQY